ncbi:MAG TPA: thymidine phosphorylase [Gemmatimonadaceae bacterium]|nr:thymidine phosphorylase [Gemmatimonadaceae bacterium]
MLALRLIERKRDRNRINPDEWRALIAAYVSGDIPDYQMAALLMAAYLNGLDTDETVALTSAMMSSGTALPKRGGPRIDKHSTGGVGDKVSLVLAPLVASLGLTVPMISGRGLGHTGGTLDKLESIPGFRTDLSLDHAAAQLDRIGCVLIGQTSELAPADRRLYALRDATATVDSIPLIAASIMSKKLVEGLDGLVLDVTIGSGAFLPTREQALTLARAMIALGAAHDCRTVAILTAMDRPLGWASGNALETEEAIHALRGEGPADLMAVTYALATEMLTLAGISADPATAISSGAAARKFQEIIEAQGGNPGVVDDPAVLPQAAKSARYLAQHPGVIARIDPRVIGQGIIALGGGRSRQEDRIDPTVGFVITVKPGDRIEANEPIATVYARDQAGLATGRTTLDRAIVIAEEPQPMLSLIMDRIGA